MQENWKKESICLYYKREEMLRFPAGKERREITIKASYPGCPEYGAFLMPV
jgi:hypothetical protein